MSKWYTEVDWYRMGALYGSLCNDSLSASEVFEMAIEHGLKTMSWRQLQNNSITATSSQIAFTNTILDRINGGDDIWGLGDSVVGRKFTRVSGKRKINLNAEFKVVGVTETHLTVRGREDIDKILTHKSSRDFSAVSGVALAMPSRGRPWAIACISTTRTLGLSPLGGSAQQSRDDTHWISSS